MKFNQLAFKRSILLKDTELSEDRPYIDFMIDGTSLSSHLGGIKDLISPYGWGNNKDFELSYAERLMKFKRSEFPNGLQSAYVCARCGDEGCGAVMFDIVNHGSYVEWCNFVYSDGYPTDSNPEEPIEIKPFCFEIGSYQNAIKQLEAMIK